MHPLDFLSDSPNIFIFKKKSNQTNFGGVLFFIYILLDIIIAIYYLIYYIKNDKYEIEYSLYINISPSDLAQDYQKFLNPYFDLSIQLYSHGDIQRLKIFDFDKYDFINITDYNKFTNINKNVKNFWLGVFYECENENCTNEKEEKSPEVPFHLTLSYNYPKINFQSQKKLITQKRTHFTTNFYYHNKTYIKNIWSNIIFKENKGFFQKENIEGCGYIDNIQKEISKEDIFQFEVNKKWYKFLMSWDIENKNSKLTEYKRKRVSLITIGANILSYFSNLFFIFKVIFLYYSNHFVNFKIIEDIYKNKINNHFLQQSNNVNNTQHKMNEQNSKKKIELINLEKEPESEIFNDKDFNFNLVDEKENAKFVKLNFIQFYLHNFYFKCFKKNISQEIISICDDILLKYCSIDSIVYNQIVLENLFRDYIWNNPALNNLNNNELFIKLNNLISNNLI